MEARTRELPGKVAVATGASQGLGEHLARKPAANGAAIANLSPRIQKLATRVRPFTPGLVDRRIHERVSTLRPAFTDEVDEHRKAKAAR